MPTNSTTTRRKRKPQKPSLVVVSVRLDEKLSVAIQRKKLDLFGDASMRVFFEYMIDKFDGKHSKTKTRPKMFAVDKNAPIKGFSVTRDFRTKLQKLTEKFACSQGELLFTALHEVLNDA